MPRVHVVSVQIVESFQYLNKTTTFVLVCQLLKWTKLISRPACLLRLLYR